MGLFDVNFELNVGGVNLEFFKKNPNAVTDIKTNDKSVKLLVFICIVIAVYAAAVIKPKELVDDLTDETPDLGKYKHGSPEGKPELGTKFPKNSGGIPITLVNFLKHIFDSVESVKNASFTFDADKTMSLISDVDATVMYDKAISYIKNMEPVESDMIITSEAELFDSIGDHVMYNRNCSHLSDEIAFTLIDLVSAIMTSNKALSYAAAGKWWFSGIARAIIK